MRINYRVATDANLSCVTSDGQSGYLAGSVLQPSASLTHCPLSSFPQPAMVASWSPAQVPSHPACQCPVAGCAGAEAV